MTGLAATGASADAAGQRAGDWSGASRNLSPPALERGTVGRFTQGALCNLTGLRRACHIGTLDL